MVFPKIRHRGVFIERQMQAKDKYLWICHTGISKFLPDLYKSQAEAIKAVDAKIDANLLAQKQALP